MTEKIYDLEGRTFEYAKKTRAFLKTLAFGESNSEDKRQLLRSSGSVAANYIEVNESLSKKDFLLRIKICKNEAKESYLWLRLIQEDIKKENQERIQVLAQESLELSKIFGSIANKYREFQ